MISPAETLPVTLLSNDANHHLTDSNVEFTSLPESQDMPPQIVSEIETIIQANDNYTLFCQGSRPLKWTVPKVAENTWTTFITMDEAPIETNYTYGSRLYIFNMTYLFVGFYYCHYEDAGEIDKGRNASTYLYVNDSTHLAPVDEDMMIMSISATQYQRVVIPCKPTSPDIKVRLYVHESEEVPVEELNSTDTPYIYDPRYGYFTYVIKEGPCLLKCEVIRGGLNRSYEIQMQVELPLSHLPTPDLKDLSGGHTIIGQPLKLECIIIKPSENEVMFHWTTPTGPPDSRMEVSAPVPTTISSYNAYKQSLTVYNTTMEDKGVYICNVTDLQGHSAHGLLDVIIFDEDEFFLNLYEAHNLSKIIARAGDEFAQWVIRVEGHPVPTITWLNNNNEIIPIGNSTYYEASFNTKTSEAFLKIKDVSINKFGYYTLLATNNKMEKSLKLFLNVTDKPTVTFHGDKSFYMVNKAATLGCSAYGNPQPILKLEHKECLTDDCDFMEIPASNVTNDGLVFTSEITFIASNPGYIKCSAKNYLGHDEGIATILLTDVENGFDIFGLDDTIDLNAEDLVATVAVGEKISLTCGASVYNYTDLHWFLNDKVLTGQDGYGISRSSTEYSHRIRLEIPRAEFSDSGEYRCGAINHGSAVFRNLTVNVTEAQVPSFRSTNLKDEIEINIPERVTMFCNAFGIPKPTITWHKALGKNASCLVMESFSTHWKSGRVITTEDNQNITFMSTEAEDEGTYTCEAKNRGGTDC
ncbi:hypothetical protein NQ317_002050 [Molorchus minor]|uniref:Ig-like domain-containing protein n=1 Tax=Molorchus minor TaxID=1323400 RepID=A0ABQ9JFI2_9CUCU|nr:hypothetical protein NQ317_002050 [Molorchus minor]